MSGGRRFSGAMVLLQLLAAAEPAAAQSLRSRFDDLFIFGDCGVPLCLAGSIAAGSGHGNHYIPAVNSRSALVIPALLGDLASSITTTVSNIPLSIGSGGATFSFVEGLPVTTPVSAGPILGERGQTLGRHRMLVGVTVTGGEFYKLRGVPLRSAEINFTHQDVGNPGLGDPQFETDIFLVRPDFRFKLLATAFTGTYGLTDFLDVGLTVPVIHASLSGQSIARIVCTAPPCFHFFAGDATNPQLSDTTSLRASATGLGDVAVRAKLGITRNRRVALALLGELRLPTGREEDFLGSGEVAFKLVGVASRTWGTFTSHANAGYFARGGKEENDAVLATIGFDNLVGQIVTMSADLVTQWQVGAQPFNLPGPTHFDLPFAADVPLMNVPDVRDNRIDGSFGLKFTNRRGLTGVVNAQFPLRSAGLQGSLIWTLGAQYDF